MRTIATILVALMLLVSIVTAAALTYSGLDDPTASHQSDGESYSPAPMPTGTASPTPSVQRLDSLAYGGPGSGSPTNRIGQSRLWFNDDTWWGVFLVAETGDHRIHRLDAAAGSWIDTAMVVDDRTFARMDVLWDGDHLVVASAGTQPEERHALRIIRFSYDPETAAYLRDANFPVPITDGGVEAVTLARSSDGRLWVAYRTGSRLAVDHSLESDLAWRGPFVPEAAFVDVDQAAIASAGDYVALVWTQPTEDEVYAAWHDVTEGGEIWMSSEPAPVGGLRWEEDSLSVAADELSARPRILAAVRTSSDDSPTRGSQDPQVVVVEFVLGEAPTTHLVSRVDDRQGPPIILVHGDAGQVYVVASVPAVGGEIVYKASPLEEIAFSTGRGIALMSPTEELLRIANPTSTKQTLTDDSGLLVAATDTRAGQYAFAGIEIPSVPVGPTDPGTDERFRTLVDQDFDGLAIGSAVRGWELEGPPFPSYVISVLTGTDSSARLSTLPEGTRACLPIRYDGDGRISIEWRFLFNLGLADELRPLQVRGEGELASLRVQDDELRYFDGADLVREEIVLQPGRWYRVGMAVDARTGTYDLVVRAPNDEIVLEDAGLTWRSLQSRTIGRACAELPGQSGLDLYLDDVVVTLEEPPN